MEHLFAPSSLQELCKHVSLAPSATLCSGHFPYYRDEETASQRLSALPKVTLPPGVQSGLELRSAGLFSSPPTHTQGDQGGEMRRESDSWRRMTVHCGRAFPPPAPAICAEPSTAGLCALGKQPAHLGGRSLQSHLLSKPL